MAATIRFGVVRDATSGTAVGLVLTEGAGGPAHPSTSTTMMTRARKCLLAIEHCPSCLADVQEHAIRVVQAELPKMAARQDLHAPRPLAVRLGKHREQLGSALHQLVQVGLEHVEVLD